MDEYADILTHFGVKGDDMEVVTLGRVEERDVRVAYKGWGDTEGNGLLLFAHYDYRKSTPSIIDVLTRSIKEVLSGVLVESDLALAEAAVLQQLTTMYHRDDMPVAVGISGNRTDGHSLLFATLYVAKPHDALQICIAWGERFSPVLNQWYETVTIAGGGVKCRVH